MKNAMRLLVLVMLVIALAGCSSNPCENCNDTPTKGFRNESSGEKEYYCDDCSSECDLCGDDVFKHYTSGAGVRFVCKDCYEELKDYGWIS